MRFLTASPNENSLIQNPASTFRVRRIGIRRLKAVWKTLHPIISQYAVIETINSLALKSFLSLKQKMVPDTYTQIYLHFVIVVKFREALIQPKYQEEVFSFMSGLINSMGHRSYAVNGMPDHVHIFMSFTPSKSPAETIKEIKRATTNFINEKKWFPGKFQWQNGYGCFSYGKSQVDTVVNYILNQKEHHRKVTFREEYLTFLKKFEVEYDTRYLFDFFE